MAAYPLSVSVKAQELAVTYRRMARNQSSPRKAGLLLLAAEVLEELSVEVLRGGASETTLEKLAALERILTLNKLPAHKLSSLIRKARAFSRPRLEVYLVPQFEVSSTILS